MWFFINYFLIKCGFTYILALNPYLIIHLLLITRNALSKFMKFLKHKCYLLFRYVYFLKWEWEMWISSIPIFNSTFQERIVNLASWAPLIFGVGSGSGTPMGRGRSGNPLLSLSFLPSFYLGSKDGYAFVRKFYWFYW